jgi:3-oxoacyl-(acyl-carrier-protein) synthase
VAVVLPDQALIDAGLDREHAASAYEALDKTRAGVLIGSGMGGLTVFQDGVKNLVEKGYKKMSPFFIPYAITNMCVTPCAKIGSPALCYDVLMVPVFLCTSCFLPH